jgi:hypothetical protein
VGFQDPSACSCLKFKIRFIITGLFISFFINKIITQKETTVKYTTLPRPHTQGEHMATGMGQH